MSLDNKVVDLADLKVSHDYLLEQDGLLSDRIDELGSGIDGIQSQITALGNGSPIPVETVAEMTDNTKAYLYTGSEQGYTSGYWYTYDSTQAKFVPRGEYGAGVIIDSTLTVTGNAADAKATGDAIKAGKTFVVQVPGSAAVLSGSITAGDFAKALAAYTAGSGVYAVKDGEVYQLSAVSSSTMTFTQMYHGTMNFIKQIQITSADTFTVTNTALSSSATDTSYSNTASGLTATNVQAAIDENAAAISNTNGRLAQLDDALGIATREGTAFDFTDEEYSTGAIANSINIIDVPLTNCKIKSITLAMNTAKTLNCMIYVVKSDLTVVKTIEGTSESAGLSHTVSIDYEIKNKDTYYIGIYFTTARAVTFGPAQTSVQTRCYEFNPSILLIGAQTKADKRRIRASLLIEAAGENKITALETDVEYMGERITALENKSEESLPDYYTDYLPAKITTLLSLDAEVGSHGDSFVFMTDYHDTSNTGYSPEIIKQIVENTATKMIVFGGDVINQYATKEQAYPHFADFHKRFLFSDAYYPIIGNHEYNDPGNTDAEYTGKRMTFSEAYGMNLRQKEVDARYKWDGGYTYHVDNEAQKIRYYLIGCNATSTIEAESRNAFFTSLESVPANYIVIVIAHQLAIYNNGNPVYGAAGQLLANGCDAYNARQTFTANSISHDYTGATGKIIILMQGHTHIDFDLTTTGGIPSVCTTCDTYAQQIGSLVRTAGTVTEQAFDIVHVNTDTKTIKLTRIGAGSDRVFTYA